MKFFNSIFKGSHFHTYEYHIHHLHLRSLCQRQVLLGESSKIHNNQIRPPAHPSMDPKKLLKAVFNLPQACFLHRINEGVVKSWLARNCYNFLQGCAIQVILIRCSPNLYLAQGYDIQHKNDSKCQCNEQLGRETYESLIEILFLYFLCFCS